MYSKIMKKLGAHEISGDTTDNFTLNDIENYLGYKLPQNYQKLLELYQSSIVFDESVIYKPIEASPVDNKKGYQSLEMLYGMNGKFNLLEMNQMYGDQISKGVVVIGESVGGSLICINKENGFIYFWHHEAIYDDVSLFLINKDIDNFIIGLELEREEDTEDRGVVASDLSFIESFLSKK